MSFGIAMNTCTLLSTYFMNFSKFETFYFECMYYWIFVSLLLLVPPPNVQS